MKSLTVQELKQMIDDKEDFKLIDVREQDEYDFVNLNAELIPVSAVADNVDKFPKDKKVVVHCRSGARSGNVILALEAEYGYDNLYNLEGGIIAWAREIDPSLPTY
jgi:adenylyltransferase/sulfurtransferase